MFQNVRNVRKKQNYAMVRAELEKQNAGQSFLLNPYVKNGIIVICMAADMATLYSIFELQMTEQQILTVIITIVIAGALNIAPVLLALCLNDKEDRSGLKKMQMAAFTGVFLILFVSTAILRWTSREELFASETGLVVSGMQEAGSGYGGMQDTEIQSNEPQDTGPQNIKLRNVNQQAQDSGIQGVTMAQNACALILLLEPLATSAVCFGLSYEKDPDRKRRQLLRLQNVRLRQQRDEYQVQIAELEQELAECNLEEYDREQYDTMRQQIELYRQYFKIHARRRLAEKDGTANAATLLLEESKLVQAIGGMKL